MKTNTRQSILDIIKKSGQARPHDLVAILHLSQVAIHKQLKKLSDQGLILKLGSPPKVYYSLTTLTPISTSTVNLPKSVIDRLEQSYLYVSPKGELMTGYNGFLYWATQVNHTKNILSLANNYLSLRHSVDTQKSPQGWIDVSTKIKQTFPNTPLNQVFCLDFYSLPVFGKTKLGNQVLIAKQSQDKLMVHSLADYAKPVIEQLISSYKLDYVAFIPPTLPRHLQFMNEFSKELHLHLPQIKLIKLKTGNVLVPQKSLSKLSERQDNAQSSIHLQDSFASIPSSSNVIIIDDAIGSGATLHQTAIKIQSTYKPKKIIGFGIVSSQKGFDIITDL